MRRKSAIKLAPVALIPYAEVWIERRYQGGSDTTLIARMVEWLPERGTEESKSPILAPVFGKCLLSPNRISDPVKAEAIVRRYLEPVCAKLTIYTNVKREPQASTAPVQSVIEMRR